jgi:hypothetical protein
VICRYPSDREEKGTHVSGDDRFLARLITLRTCTGRAGRTMLPPLDVVDWWEHPGELRLTVARGVSAGSMSRSIRRAALEASGPPCSIIGGNARS